MADLRIVDAPLLSTVKGTEKLPTGGEGNFSVSVNQVADFAKLKWFLATEDYVDNAVGNVQADLNLHKNNESNPHNVTKTQVGLGNVDNTADLDKPLSNATQSAIITANSGKADKSYVDSQDISLQLQINQKAETEYVDAALSNLSTVASKFYPTLAQANVDIANIVVNQVVNIGEVANGGLWYKATTGATSLTKSPYDPLTQSKSYTDLYARSSAYDNTRHLDTYETEGRYTFRFHVDATTEKGFPPESVGKLGFFEVFRNGTDSTVVQKITVEATLILYRKKSGGVWESKWRLAKRVQDISTPTNLLTFALAQKDYTVATVRTNIGTLANGYPYEGAQGTIEVFANDDWSAKTIRFTSVNRQVWICTYRDNTGTGTWSEWVRLDYNDGGIFGILDKAKTTLFDFNDIASVGAATLNVPIKIAYSESNLTQVQPYAGFSSSTAVLSTVGGGTALTSIASASAPGQYKTTVNLLTAVNQTLAIAFYHDDNSTVHSIFSQTAAGQAGRLQIAANCYYTGSVLAYEKDSLCVFLGGASEGSGINSSVKKGQLLKGWNTLILQIGAGSKASKLLVNGKLTDTFTSTIYNTESVIFPALVSSAKSMVKIGRIVSYKDILSDEAIDQLQQWLIKPYKAPDKSPISSYELSRKPVKHTAISGVTLSSSLAAGCMLASDDGSYIARDVLYTYNPESQLSIYSTTKIMTFIVLMDMQVNLNEVLTRTEFDPAIGSGANLGVGDQIYLRDALYNLMLPSSNVSARIIARTFGHKLLIKDGVTGGTDAQAVARWVAQMNAKATEIGMTNTTYATPDGNSVNDVSTVIDLLKKGNYALKYPLLNKVWSTKSYTLDVFGQNPRAITVTNSNTLLDNDYTIGGKSGSADVTNLVSVHQMPDLQKLVTVVLHSTTTQDRNADTMSMVNVALSRYS